MKTYGKEPESLESIIRIFTRDLGHFPADKVMKAISVHSQRSQEFPTVSDIVGLIKRKGKPPLKESDIISIRKKDGEFRTPEEWQMLREWDNEQQEGWSDEPDPVKDAATLAENIRLRAELTALKAEYQRLGDMLKAEREGKPLPPPRPLKTAHTLEEKIKNTIAQMKADGAHQEDIDQFCRDYGVPIEPVSS